MCVRIISRYRFDEDTSYRKNYNATHSNNTTDNETENYMKMSSEKRLNQFPFSFAHTDFTIGVAIELTLDCGNEILRPIKW